LGDDFAPGDVLASKHCPPLGALDRKATAEEERAMPIFNRWIHPQVSRDLARIWTSAPPARRPHIAHAANLLRQMIRYDPDHQGTPPIADPAVRVLTLGPLCALCRVRPVDLVVELRGFFPNVHWVD
jgi:hypothetical protein